MSEETENEVVLIEHPCDTPDHKHVHDQREVVCKPGERVIVLDPILIAQGARVVGHDQRHRYVRTADNDSLGRAIFRAEAMG